MVHQGEDSNPVGTENCTEIYGCSVDRLNETRRYKHLTGDLINKELIKVLRYTHPRGEFINEELIKTQKYKHLTEEVRVHQ